MGYKIAIKDEEDMYLSKDCKSFGPAGFVWQEKNKAGNVLKSCKNSLRFQHFKDRLEIVEVLGPDEKMVSASVQRLKTAAGRQELTDLVLKLASLVPDPKAVVESYSQLLSEADKEKEDLLEVIELQEMTAEEELVYYQDLREILAKRRKIKDFLAVVTTLMPSYSNILSAAKLINNREKRTYTPRVIQPLSEINRPHILQLQSVPDSQEDAMNTDSISDLPAEVKAQIRDFAEKYAENYRESHQVKKDGTWSELGQADCVCSFAIAYELWQKLLSEGQEKGDIARRLEKLVNQQKVDQLFRGTGYISKVVRAWQKEAVTSN